MAAAANSQTTSPTPIVSVRNVTKAFGDNHVLRGVSLDIPKGTAAALIGPSGSGKSTLLRCINGLVGVDGGEVHAAGHAVHALRDDKERIALRRDVSMVFQQYNLFPHMTALENVMLGPIHVLKQPREEVEARAVALLAKVRLSGK